jgi:hypothetical protein
MQNNEVKALAMKNSYYVKNYTFPSGHIISCQGYEPLAINLLLRNGIDENDIWIDDQVGSCKAFPKFMYEYDDSIHRYYPDIYVASEDRFIEVKSEYTM